MYAENLEAAEEVILRLFDPRRTYKKAYISPEIKLAYLQHYLESRWAEIVGENLARSCAIEKNKRQRALCAHGQQYAGQRAVYDAAAVSAKNQLLFAGTRAD